MLPLHFSNLEQKELNTVIASYFKSSTGIRILDTKLPDCASFNHYTTRSIGIQRVNSGLNRD